MSTLYLRKHVTNWSELKRRLYVFANKPSSDPDFVDFLSSLKVTTGDAKAGVIVARMLEEAKAMLSAEHEKGNT